jgi:lysophospholipase L1-like esterase
MRNFLHRFNVGDLGLIDWFTPENQHPADKYFVLIMYGANDRGQGVSSTDTGFNVGQMIEKVSAFDDAIPVVGSIPTRTDESFTYRNKHI